MSVKKCRSLVERRSNGLCEICGQHVGETMHHRKREGQGGPWLPSNVLYLCGDGTTGHHGMVTNTRAVYYQAGWCVESWEDPHKRAVLLHHGFVWLTDDGMMPPAVDLARSARWRHG
ncbi:HNH endonuclease [Amycolatopsis palatopharyngis]|uniref:HNH endonuclease n=1 Tax=Amycolatopsis palatopharyngis TaxID=187982 RepID=UPI000E24E0C2|nr:HNH endonuclease [Amycolatopsis palatopharyngis]